jgi:hypothetical protein
MRLIVTPAQGNDRVPADRTNLKGCSKTLDTLAGPLLASVSAVVEIVKNARKKQSGVGGGRVRASTVTVSIHRRVRYMRCTAIRHPKAT